MYFHLTHHPQAFDGSGGWGNTSGVARGEGDWVSSLETNQKAGSILMRDLQGHMPAGTYTLMWDGDGIVDVGAFDVQETRWVGDGWWHHQGAYSGPWGAWTDSQQLQWHACLLLLFSPVCYRGTESTSDISGDSDS